MTEFPKDKAVQNYLLLMHELAIRIDLVAHVCKGELNLTPPYAREYAYLQFRRMCELIALGSLLLHGDIANVESMRREWNAEKIMRKLQKSHPYAFPQSATMEKTSGGWKIRGNSMPNALTASEFKNLYCECGEVLHRGTIRSLEADEGISENDYQKVIDWSKKMVDLMNDHIIVREPNKSYYHISLRTETGAPECSIVTVNENGEIQVATTKAVL